MDKCPTDLKTSGYVLRRTNYGEADRIINFITKDGYVSAIAKGVRKPRSKLAGGIEMFTLSELNFHFGKSDLATLIGAKMQKFHSNIMKDLAKMEKATEFLKAIGRFSSSIDSPDFFKILDTCLTALDKNQNLNLIDAWFYINLKKSAGEELNLYTDVNGEKLSANLTYFWHGTEMAFSPINLETATHNSDEDIVDANTIKLLRIIYTADLSIATRVKDLEIYLPKISKIAQALKK